MQATTRFFGAPYVVPRVSSSTWEHNTNTALAITDAGFSTTTLPETPSQDIVDLACRTFEQGCNGTISSDDASQQLRRLYCLVWSDKRILLLTLFVTKNQK